jgi:hypothetical protein
MGQVGQAFARELAPLIRFNAKVVDIHQDEHGVRATYEDTAAGSGRQTVQADWCVCTIPLSILLLAIAVVLGWGLPGVALAAAVTDAVFAVSALWLALGFFMPRAIDRGLEILRVFSPLVAAGALWAICEGVRHVVGLSNDKVGGGLLSLAMFCVIFGVFALLLLRSAFGRKAFGLDQLHELH